MSQDPSLTMFDAVTDFLRSGRATIPLKTSHIVPRAIAAIAKLIDDPARDAWGLYIPRPGAEPDDRDDGLIRRTKAYANDTSADDKWFFHYRPGLLDHLEAHGVDTSAHTDLFEACHELYEICFGGVMNFAEAYDQAVPHIGLYNRLIAAQAPHVLRVLFYDLGANMARPHTDRDALTLHVAESRPGLRIGKDRERYEAPVDKALVFPGQKFATLTRGHIPALLHEVADDSAETTTNERRWSVVFFTHV